MADAPAACAAPEGRRRTDELQEAERKPRKVQDGKPHLAWRCMEEFSGRRVH